MLIKDVLKRPVISEKAMGQAVIGQYTFAVDRRATKPEISRAVAEAFKVHPVSVRVIKVHGKVRSAQKTRKKTRTADWKKAIITLKEGEKIDLFETGE